MKRTSQSNHAANLVTQAPSQKSKRVLGRLTVLFLAVVGAAIVFVIIFGALLISALTK